MSRWIETNWIRALALGSIALWLLSLALPAYFSLMEWLPGMPPTPDQSDTTYGILCLLVGPMGPGIISTADPDTIPSGFHALLPPTAVGAFLASFSW